ncbi:MAG: ArnT family glycosyltransferase [Chloroflexota bacterium]
MTRIRIIPASMTIGVIVLYWLTRTDVHTFDALSYILDVMRKPWNELFHPHHLAYGPFGSLMVTLLGGTAEHALQHANAIAGGLGAGVLTAIVLRRYQRNDLAILAGLALSGSYAYWYYAIEVEVYTVAALFLLCVIWFIDRPQPTKWQWIFGLGVSIAGAVLFHQTNALLALPLIVAMVSDARTNQAHWRGWILAGVIAVGIVAGAYSYVMFVVSGFADWPTAQQWLFQYATTGWWGGKATFGDIYDGISQTIAWSYGAIIGVSTVGISIWHARQQSFVRESWHLWSWSWLILYAGFFTWWEPDNIEFWIAVTPLIILLVLAPVRHTSGWSWPVRGLLGLAAVTFGINYSAIEQRGDATQDLQRNIAQAVAERSNTGDLLLIPDGLQELYLPFYHGREHFMSVNATIAQTGDWLRACQELRQRIDLSQRAGAQIIIASDFLVPTQTMQQRFGLSQTSVTECLGDLLPLMQSLDMPINVPAHTVIPTPAQQLIAGDWQRASMPLLGWELANMQHEQHQLPWRFRAQRDPNLISPILDMPLPKRITFDIEVSGTVDQTAQLFVSDIMKIFNESQSLRWQLQPGRQTYTIEFVALANTPARLVQFRFDPVADGANGTITIYGISIAP